MSTGGTPQPHGRLEELAAGLHCVRGTFGRSPLGRRMTVVVPPAGRLALHSPVRLDDAGMAALEALGPVGWLVAPNSFHWADVPWYAARYPEARVLAPAAAHGKLAPHVRLDGSLEDDWPPELAGTLERLPLEGMKTGEHAFFHPPSRTLILTDLVFNMGTEARGPARWLLRLNRAHGRFGPTRLLRWVFLRDAAALLASLRRLEEWDYDRVVVSHGDVLERGGKAAMAAAFADWTA